MGLFKSSTNGGNNNRCIFCVHWCGSPARKTSTNNLWEYDYNERVKCPKRGTFVTASGSACKYFEFDSWKYNA